MLKLVSSTDAASRSRRTQSPFRPLYRDSRTTRERGLCVGSNRSVPSRLGYALTSDAPAVKWLMWKTTNFPGSTGAIPISTTTRPASITSGGFVSASHLT
jgi:hypothetical protein